ncbi:MAG: hypothetical protein ACXWRE_04450 [Pseudobdellovibrionaceae bacterium]
MNLKIFAGFLPAILFVTTVSALDSNQYYLADFWSGEYPDPVIKITADTKIKALKKIPVSTSVKSVSCTVSKGVYHPWATKTTATYHSVTGITVHEARVATTIELEHTRGTKKISLKPGDIVRRLAYISEGNCVIEIKGLKGDAMCPEEKEFKTIVASDYYRQYLKVSCQEGYPAYISVTDDIFKIKGIKRGNIADYGRVDE